MTIEKSHNNDIITFVFSPQNANLKILKVNFGIKFKSSSFPFRMAIIWDQRLSALAHSIIRLFTFTFLVKTTKLKSLMWMGHGETVSSKHILSLYVFLRTILRQPAGKYDSQSLQWMQTSWNKLAMC